MTRSVTFRLDDDKLQFLDTLAGSRDRDRSYLLNEAVENYVELHQWQINEIRQGLADADAGELASEAEVKAAFDAFTQP